MVATFNGEFGRKEGEMWESPTRLNNMLTFFGYRVPFEIVKIHEFNNCSSFFVCFSGDPSLPVVSCECCRKQAGLWNYTQRKADTDVKEEENVDEKQKEEDVEPPQKRIKV